MRCRLATHVVIPLVVLLGATTAGGTPITFEFGGEVIWVAEDYGTLTGLIEQGDAYIARFVVESTTPDLEPDSVTRGVYDILSAQLIVGQVTFSGNQGDGKVLVTNTSTYDELYLSGHCSSVPDLGSSIHQAVFMDRTGNVFSSDALPVPGSAPDILAFQEVSFLAGWWPSKPMKFACTITYLTVVPEPGTLAFFVLLLGTLFRRVVPRREKRGKEGQSPI